MVTESYQNDSACLMLSTALSPRLSQTVDQVSSAQLRTRSIRTVSVGAARDGANHIVWCIAAGVLAARRDECAAETDVVGSLRPATRSGA